MIQTRKYVSRQEQQSQQSTWHIEPTTSATFCIDVDKHFMPKAEYFEHFCSDVLNPHTPKKNQLSMLPMQIDNDGPAKNFSNSILKKNAAKSMLP
jgi:hypothetical protein